MARKNEGKLNLTAALLTAVYTGKRTLPTGRYSDGRNLYLKVRGPKAMNWVFMGVAAGRRAEIGLGSFLGTGKSTRLNLIQARAAAEDVRAKLAANGDPLGERKQAKAAAILFSQALEEFIKQSMTGQDAWKVKNGKCATELSWRAMFKNYAASLLTTPCGKVDQPMVLRLITAEQEDGASLWSTTIGDVLRQRIEVVLDYAKAKGYREGANPAAWKGGLQPLLLNKTAKSRAGGFTALSHHAQPDLMTKLVKLDTLAAKALQFITLTAVRKEEACQALWSEIDIARKTWTIPAERMKMGVEHRVPLSDQAIALLGALPRLDNNPHVFPGRGDGASINSATVEGVIRDLGLAGKMTIHGQRKAFSTYMGEETGADAEAVEMCLAHVVGGVRGVYMTGAMIAKRAKIMQTWADYVTGKGATVHQLKQVA